MNGLAGLSGLSAVSGSGRWEEKSGVQQQQQQQGRDWAHSHMSHGQLWTQAWIKKESKWTKKAT